MKADIARRSTRLAIVGVDEAGRGPLAGPVVAAAVVLGPRIPPGLGDSKQKSAAQRERLYAAIFASATAIGVGQAEVEEIDRINILRASLRAMERAVAALTCELHEVLVDGNQRPDLPWPTRTIVGGDASEPAISAASIIAKVTRDRLMIELDVHYPHYGFIRHKGYPTREHLAALALHGVSPLHRRSFAPVRRVLETERSR